MHESLSRQCQRRHEVACLMTQLDFYRGIVVGWRLFTGVDHCRIVDRGRHARVLDCTVHPCARQGSTVLIAMLTSACSSAPELDRQTTPDSRHRMPRLGYSERRSTRRAVKRSTARRSTAGSTAIREHAVTAVGIRTNETLRHTFRTGRRAAATRATHGRAGEAPPTVCQQPARVVRDESWDESLAPYYNLYAGTPRDSSGTNGASGCQPRNQDTQVHILRRLEKVSWESSALQLGGQVARSGCWKLGTGS